MNRALKTILFFLIAVTFISISSNAEKIDTAANVVSYYNDINVRLLANTKYSNLNIQNPALPADVQWRTNDNNNLGFGANYKWAGLNLLFNLPGLNEDDEIYGKTTSFNLLFNIYTKRIGVDLILQQTQGFYLDSPNDWYPSWNTQINFPINSSLSIGNVGLNFLYVLNPEKYSMRANFVLNERQLKSAGSPIFGGYLNAVSINSDSSFLPISLLDEDQKTIDIRSAGYVTLGGFFGYAHSFIIKEKFFISFAAALGLAIQGSEIQTKLETYNNVDQRGINSKFHLRSSIGYADDNYFFSLSLIGDNNNLGKSLTYNFGIARLTAGYRIKMKKKRKSG